jgi:hypothetical protein
MIARLPTAIPPPDVRALLQFAKRHCVITRARGALGKSGDAKVNLEIALGPWRLAWGAADREWGEMAGAAFEQESMGRSRAAAEKRNHMDTDRIFRSFRESESLFERKYKGV